MNRKDFLIRMGAGLAGLMVPGFFLRACNPKSVGKLKNWVWITTDLEASDTTWQKQFARFKQVGIDAILPEIFDSRLAYYSSQHLPVGGEWLEQILPLAKKEGLEVHAWIWTMPCNIPTIGVKHPEWFMVNGVGESALEKPAYVNYYKFLCPNRKEVQDFLMKRVEELAKYAELDGIHLDYIRYPDVILAEALQPKYRIVQDREHLEFDYCYCEVCQNIFKARNGFNPLELKDPTTNTLWRQFRYDSITSLVNNKLVPIAQKYGKQITAAVFPNWEAVRQQWFIWHLNGFMPMLYHSFYNANIDWIKNQVLEKVKTLQGRAPLYSGLFIPELSPGDLTHAIQVSLKSGASGVCFFHAAAINDEYWQRVANLLKKV